MSLTPMRIVPMCLVLAAATATAAAGPAFVNYETQQCQPVSVSTNGANIYAVNTPDNRLSIFDAATLRLVDEIPVGLEPVSVAQRPGTQEVWVVNNLSDSLSVVSPASRTVVATVPVGDAPAAIAFTPDGSKAYVTISGRNRVDVIDAPSRRAVRSIPIGGADPRGIAMSPDGKTLYVAPFKSGNQTRGLPPDPPLRGSTIVLDTELSDHDLFAIRTSDDTQIGVADHLGTLMTSVRVNPQGTLLYAANTDARNLIFGEQSLRGIAVDNRLAILDATTLRLIRQVDLDGAEPSRSNSAAQPMDTAFDATGSKVYLAAFGAGAIQVLDASGNKIKRIRVGAGPRGLAYDSANNTLYVLNRIDQTLSAIDVQSDLVRQTVPVGFDPTPSTIREGRRFLYKAQLSGTGKFACAGCHEGGHFDNLVWDLGTAEDPKGPMFTQSLRGLAHMSPYHWRGDRPDLNSFNPAFENLMGGRRLSDKDMQLFSDFMNTIVYPQNPNEATDRTLSGAAKRGFDVFQKPGTTGIGACVSCHTLMTSSGEPAFGTNRQIMSAPNKPLIAMKVPQLRGLAEKSGFEHDGAQRTLNDLLSEPVFRLTAEGRSDLVVFLEQFESETMPAVGLSRTLDFSDCNESETTSVIGLLMDRASREIRPGAGTKEIQLQVTGRMLATDGSWRTASLLYEPDHSPPDYVSDVTGDGPYAYDQLHALACQNQAVLTFQGIADGTGVRTLDRDLDGLMDGDETSVFRTNPGNPDTDGDGLTDADEARSGLSDPLLADTDADGVDDAHELEDGTNPRDAYSFIKLTTTVRSGATGVTLTWTTEAGARYVVEGADVASGLVPASPSDLIWTKLYTSAVPEDESPMGTESYTDPSVLAAGTVRLYRVRIAT